MISVLLVSLGSLILVVLGILCLPLSYRIHFKKHDHTALLGRVSWSGLVVASYQIGEGLKLRALGIPISLSTRLSATKARPTKDRVEKKTRRRGKLLSLDFKAMWFILRDVIQHVRPKRLEGDLRLGFEDPYYSGLVSALLSTLSWWEKYSLRLTPVFEEASLEGWFLVEGKVIPLMVLYYGLKGYAPIFVENINRKLKLRGRKVENHV